MKKSAETHIISYEETHLIPSTLADGGHPRYIQQINAYSQKTWKLTNVRQIGHTDVLVLDTYRIASISTRN